MLLQKDKLYERENEFDGMIFIGKIDNIVLKLGKTFEFWMLTDPDTLTYLRVGAINFNDYPRAWMRFVPRKKKTSDAK